MSDKLSVHTNPVNPHGAAAGAFKDTVPPLFTGRISATSGERGFGFIEFNSIKRIGGPAFELPIKDLMIHVRDNRKLPDPIPKGLWINFYVRSTRLMRDGVLVYDATETR